MKYKAMLILLAAALPLSACTKRGSEVETSSNPEISVSESSSASESSTASESSSTTVSETSQPSSEQTTDSESEALTTTSRDAASTSSSEHKEGENFVEDSPRLAGVYTDDQGQEMKVYNALDFSLLDLNGERHSLKDYKGKVVLLNFWRSWCGYCMTELPEIQEIADHFADRDDIVFLTVNSPADYDQNGLGNEPKTAEDLGKLLTEKGVKLPMLIDEENALFLNYGFRGFPATVIINPEGYLMVIQGGAIPKDVLQQVLDKILSEPTVDLQPASN
ncbi:MAG: TlpA disulfide reductase family protein [Eubacteriales bacterium]|nr:TlpA disulfide reductase family protein [Eubacteriales bacterium]